MSRRDRQYGLRYPFNNSVDYTRLGLHKEQTKLKTRGKNMELEIKEHKTIPAGEHYGVIIGVEYRKVPLEYTDYHLSFVADSERVTVKASYPTNITPETIHGKMLMRFGLEIVPGLKVDPDKLIGIKCQFTTLNKTTPKGTFPEVLRDTLIPMPVVMGVDKAIPGIDRTVINNQPVNTQQNNPEQPKPYKLPQLNEIMK